MLERDVETYFRKTVQALGGETWKFVSPAQRGVCDRIALMPDGRVWFVEIKRPGGRLTQLQKRFGERVGALKGNYTCLWSREDVDVWAIQS